MKCIKLMLEKGIDRNIVNNQNQIPLQIALQLNASNIGNTL